MLERRGLFGQNVKMPRLLLYQYAIHPNIIARIICSGEGIMSLVRCYTGHVVRFLCGSFISHACKIASTVTSTTIGTGGGTTALRSGFISSKMTMIYYIGNM